MASPASALSSAPAVRAELRVRTFDLGAQVRWVFFDAANQIVSDKEALPRDGKGQLLYPSLPVTMVWSDEETGWTLEEAELEITILSGAATIQTKASTQRQEDEPPIDRSDFGPLQISRRWRISLRIVREDWMRTFTIDPRDLLVNERPVPGLPGTLVPAGASDVGN